jgi:hypothetical protein
LVIDTYVLLLYATIWTVFYWFLSQYIAQLSRDKWVEYVRSEDSDEVLVEALQAVVAEIEDRMHDKLQQFQDSFFGSVGAMTKKAKELDPMNNVRKAAKDGDWMSLMVEYAANKAGLGALVGQQGAKKAEKEGVNGPKKALNTDYLVDYLQK